MTDDDIYTVGEVPPALVPLADLERERLWRANAQADLHELEQKYNALVAACRELVAEHDKGHGGEMWYAEAMATAFDRLRPHLPPR